MAQHRQTNDDSLLYPLALALAMWLGLMVVIGGINRLSEEASKQATLEMVNEKAFKSAVLTP